MTRQQFTETLDRAMREAVRQGGSTVVSLDFLETVAREIAMKREPLFQVAQYAHDLPEMD